MKKKIIELGKKYELKLHVFCWREQFDIIIYKVNIENSSGCFIGYYHYYTGKTSDCIVYQSKNILPQIEKDLINYKAQ